MLPRLTLLLMALALATPALAGGHPNGKPSEFYAIQRGTDRKSPDAEPSNVDTRPTGTTTPACSGKACKSPPR
jgi:hypothetical protein